MKLLFFLALSLAATDWAAAQYNCDADEKLKRSWCGNCLEANTCFGTETTQPKVTTLCDITQGETCMVETVGNTKIASCVKTNNPKCSSVCSSGKIKICDPVDQDGMSRLFCQANKIAFANKCPNDNVCENGNCVAAKTAGGCSAEKNANKLIPTPPNCQNYALCDNAKKVAFSSSCPNANQYYDPDGECQTAPYVPCRGVLIQGYVADKRDETKYLFCNRNTLVGSVRQCAAATPKWDDTTKQCSASTDAKTNAPLAGCDFGSSGGDSGGGSSGSGTCTAGSRAAGDTNSCTTYKICRSDGVWVTGATCSSGYAFNPTSQNCEPRANVPGCATSSG